MKSHESRRSNSSTTSITRGQSSPKETGRALIAKGLVSFRIDAYRKDAARQHNLSIFYPPSFPRARFERVQTHGDWSSYDPALYNQPHPRTMTLAPNGPLNDSQAFEYGQPEPASLGRSGEKSTTSRSPGVARLMHLWESKGQTNGAFKFPQAQSIGSPASSDNILQQLASDTEGCRRIAHTFVKTGPPLFDKLPAQHIGSLAPRSFGPQTELVGQRLYAFIQDEAATSDLSDQSAMHYGATNACNTDRDPEENSRLAFHTHQLSNSGSTTPGSFHSCEAFLPSSLAQGKANTLPLGHIRHGIKSQSADPDISIKEKDVGSERSSETNYSTPSALCKTSAEAGSERRRRQAGSSSSKIPTLAGQRLRRLCSDATYLSSKNISEAYDAQRRSNIDRLSRSTQSIIEPVQGPYQTVCCGHSGDRRGRSLQRSASARSTSSQNVFPVQRSFSCVTDAPSNITSTSLAPAILRRPRRRFLPHGRSEYTIDDQKTIQAVVVRDVSASGTSSSSSVYYSMDHTIGNSVERQGSCGFGDEETIRGSARATEPPVQDPAGLAESALSNAATQTDGVDHDPEQTVSEWSDSEMVAERSGRPTHHRLPRVIRLERRLRRPTVRKVQVVISLDGTSDLALDGELRRKRRD
ncbi:MAG: hypothetical protein Q9181_001273 [Wetmoreana brouardii]